MFRCHAAKPRDEDPEMCAPATAPVGEESEPSAALESSKEPEQGHPPCSPVHLYGSSHFRASEETEQLHNTELSSATPWNDLVEVTAGSAFDNQDSVASLLGRRVTAILDESKEFCHLILSALDSSFHPCRKIEDRIAHFLLIVATLQNRPGASTKTIVVTLNKNGVLRPDNGTISAKLVFTALGWVTSLYVPDLADHNQPFHVDKEGAVCFQNAQADADVEARPVIEVIREFGNILRMRSERQLDTNGSQPVVDTEGLNVASLNIATLTRVGKVRIDWTASISSHLDFDTASLDPVTGTITPVLKIYRYPCLCLQYSPETSILASLLKDWYDQYTIPTNFTPKALVQAVLLSYRLLVRFDRKAQCIYRKLTKELAMSSDSDTRLDKLCLGESRESISPCGYFWRNRPEGYREAFNAASDFPIFASRLAKIEYFIDSIQPNRITSLWRDKRDILRWYTFWAVFILGSINLVAAFLQTLFSGRQLRLAEMALAAEQAGQSNGTDKGLGNRIST